MIPLLMAFSTTALAGGWTQPDGGHYLKVWSRALVGGAGFFEDGAVVPLSPETTYRDVNLNLYGEYGITDDWTVTVSAAPVGYAALSAEGDLGLGLVAPSGSNLYSGLMLVGARRALLTEAVRLAVEGRAGGTLPQDTALGGGIIDGDTVWFWRSAVPTAQAELELQAGYGWGRSWVTAAVGGRYQSAAELLPSMLGGVSVGRSGERVSLSFGVSTVQPLGPVEDANISGAGQTRYIGVEPGVAVKLTERLSLVASVGGAPLAQANAATPAFNLGFSHQ